jgi:ATP-dependent DNA ligase
MLATSSAPFDDPRWLFEVKWDGVRAIASVGERNWRVWRERVDYTARYPELDALRRLPAGTTLDGELVAVRDGRPDFHALMRRHARTRRARFCAEPIHYMVFDLLCFRGRSLMELPFFERRKMLHDHVLDVPYVSLCDGVVGPGRPSFRAALAAGHEGVVAKRLTSLYVPGKRILGPLRAFAGRSFRIWIGSRPPDQT